MAPDIDGEAMGAPSPAVDGGGSGVATALSAIAGAEILQKFDLSEAWPRSQASADDEAVLDGVSKTGRRGLKFGPALDAVGLQLRVHGLVTQALASKQAEVLGERDEAHELLRIERSRPCHVATQRTRAVDDRVALASVGECRKSPSGSIQSLFLDSTRQLHTSRKAP